MLLNIVWLFYVENVKKILTRSNGLKDQLSYELNLSLLLCILYKKVKEFLICISLYEVMNKLEYNAKIWRTYFKHVWYKSCLQT